MFFLVICHLLVVYLPNTISTNTPSATSQTSDTTGTSTSSRSSMHNPCRGRIRPRSEGLSEGDQQYLSSSLWKKCLVECNLSPRSEEDALVQLVTQTGELLETFNSFKDRFVSTVNNNFHGTSFNFTKRYLCIHFRQFKTIFVIFFVFIGTSCYPFKL